MRRNRLVTTLLHGLRARSSSGGEGRRHRGNELQAPGGMGEEREGKGGVNIEMNQMSGLVLSRRSVFDGAF